MKNRYYLMRHGESEPNLKRLIADKSSESIAKNGLTPKGKLQAASSAKELASKKDLQPVVISSDFLRAYETAQIVAKDLDVDVKKDVRLRERNFGEFSGKSIDNYERVWAISDKNPSATPFGAESTNAVLARMKAVVKDCEDNYANKDILLVGHGDPLIIAYSFFKYGVLTKMIHHFSNAEIRKLI